MTPDNRKTVPWAELRDRQKAKREREMNELFKPWYEDPKELARLWRWLRIRNLEPGDAADFIERAGTDYAAEREYMTTMCGPR